MNTEAIAYTPPWRLIVGLLIAISRGSTLVLVALLLFFDTRLGNQLRLMRAFTTFCLLPGIAAWLLQRACAVTVLMQAGLVVLQHRRWRIEIPTEAIVGVIPWTIPLPSGGVWLRLRSGRRFERGLHVADPVGFIDALAQAGASPGIRTASDLWSVAYARAKDAVARRWYHPVLKFVVFGLVPTLPLFRLHQWVAYGGTFGEYYTFGLKAYLLAFGIYWITYVIYLVLYAAVLRAVVETAALTATYVAPSRAPAVRRAVELADGVLYYGGVVALLVRLALSS